MRCVSGWIGTVPEEVGRPRVPAYTLAVALAAVAVGCEVAYKVPTAPEKKTGSGQGSAAGTTGGPDMADAERDLLRGVRHGFRRDPMKYVEEAEGLQAALVRKLVFGKAKPSDEDTIEAHFREAFAKQNADGSLEDAHDQGVLGATGETLVGLLRMGCAPGRAEMKLALEAVEKALGELPVDDAPSACYGLHALSAAGRPMDARAKRLIERLAKDTVDKLGTGCPGTPFVQVSALWSCREHADLDDDVEAVLRWVEGAVEPPGCSRALGLCHPNGIVEMVAQIEHPTSRRIALKLVPMLLRGQETDGGWGEATFHAFTALERHGLLDRLRALPPLPPDWKVVRSIPAPVSHGFSVLAFDDGVIWMNDPKSATAVAVSPEDGRVVRTVELPKRPGCVAFGAWGGSLWVLPGQPKEPDKTLYQVDSGTGKVVREIPIPFEVRHFAGLIRSEGKALICDQWEGCVRAFDPDAPAEHEERRLAAGMPDFAASVGREIWALDSWAPAIVKTNLKGELLDWGERPFGWAAIAWDGEHLWAFDRKNKRICMIEKNAPGPKRDAATARAKELLKGRKHGFRVDPMKYVEEGKGLEAALVRKQVFGRPKPGDEEIIRAEIDKVLAEQRGDGALGDDFNDTADKVLKLLSLGCPPDRREVALALDWVEKAAGGTDVDMRRVLEVLVGAGRTDRPLVKRELGRMAKRTVAGLGGGCPGTPYAQLRVLWLGRGAAGVGREIESILKWLEDAVEPPGCSRTLGLCYIWGIFETLGEIDHRGAARITAKLVPMIVRCQGDDGGWKDCYGKEKSLWFFRALALHGLLEPLRELPPLPPDWRIARSIPAPGEKPGNIGFGHGHLWVLGDGALTAVSEEDGSVIKRVKLAPRPGRSHFALAAGDGTFWLSAFADKKKNRPAAVVEFDERTGEIKRDIPLTITNDPMGIAKVGSKLLVGDGWAGGTWLVDLKKPDQEPPAHRVAASMPDYMSSHGDDIWCVDWFSPSLVRTNMAGDLVDWGERPFGFEPVAYDGRNLWALDTRYKRICLIEKAGGQRVPKATRPLRDDLRNYFNSGGGFVYAAPGMTDDRRQEWARVLGLPHEERLRAMAEEAAKVGCTQATLGDAVLWLGAEGTIDALLMVVDKDDVRGMRRFMDLLAETGSPVAFIIIRCDGYYDVLSMQPDWYIRHNNQPRDPAMKLRPPRPGIREDLHGINWKATWPRPEEMYAAPLPDVVRAHAELAEKYGCTQSVDDGILLWRKEGGELEAMLCVCDDTDLDRLRGLYARIEATDCPLTWLFLRLTHWEGPVFDILSLSRRHYMAHRNRIGNWHARPRRLRQEVKEESTETF